MSSQVSYGAKDLAVQQQIRDFHNWSAMLIRWRSIACIFWFVVIASVSISFLQHLMRSLLSWLHAEELLAAFYGYCIVFISCGVVTTLIHSSMFNVLSFSVTARPPRRPAAFLLEVLIPRNILFLILTVTLGFFAHRSMLHMLSSGLVAAPLIRVCDVHSVRNRCIDAESLLAHVCAVAAALVGALHFLYVQMHYLQFPSLLQWRTWRLRAAMRSSAWRCLILAGEIASIVCAACLIVSWAVQQPLLSRYTARVRLLPWRFDLIQWLELLLATLGWLLSLHLSRHVAAVILTHVVSFDASLGPSPVTVVNTSAGRTAMAVSPGALVAHHYLPNLILGLDTSTQLIRYYAYQNLAHAAQHSAERRQLMYGANAFDARGAEGIWRGLFSRSCGPLETLLKSLRPSPTDRVTPVAVALQHKQLYLWALTAVSSLISKSKTEDQYGIVQSTNSIQSALVLLLELHSALEDVMQAPTRPVSIEGAHVERPTVLALHSAVCLAIYEISTTFFESMSYFRFPEHLVSKLYTFLQFNE